MQQIFGKLRSLPPVHIELYRALRAQRSVNGVSGPVGRVLLQWTYKIGEPYVNYCASLIHVSLFSWTVKAIPKEPSVSFS